MLYLGTQDAVDEAVRRSGADPVPPANPYWARNGVTIEDPDGWRVVLVPAPWVP